MILLFCIIVMGVSCIPMDFNDDYWDWIVKNDTEQILILKYPSGNYIDHTSWYDTYTLQPGDWAGIGHRAIRRGKKLHFDNYFERIVSLHGQEVYWQILSEDQTSVLRTWRYSEKDQSDQQFFSESSWRFKQNSGGDGQEYLWTFEIQQEDISSN